LAKATVRPGQVLSWTAALWLVAFVFIVVWLGVAAASGDQTLTSSAQVAGDTVGPAGWFTNAFWDTFGRSFWWLLISAPAYLAGAGAMILVRRKR
jgi:hypothetical protein